MNNFKNVYLKWDGRISRKTYWIYSIPIAVIVLLSGMLSELNDVRLSLVILSLVFYPAIMINIKRAHDRNKSGWFTILLFIPLISIWPMIELGFVKGSDAANKYGEPDCIWIGVSKN